MYGSRRLKVLYWEHERRIALLVLLAVIIGLLLGAFILWPPTPTLTIRDCNTTTLDPTWGPVITGDGC